MAHEIIKIGVLPNDGLGDPLRVAFDKINHNFATLFTASPNMYPELIVTGKGANDGTGDTLTTAFDKLNLNFGNLYSLTPGLLPVKFSVTDPLRTTFEKVNASFSNLFEILAPNEPTVVEIIDPTIQNVDATDATDASVNINITNNYNFFVNNEQTSPTAEVQPKLAGPQIAPTLVGPYGVQEYINVGTQPNDGTGDPLRTAFQKINNNFSNLFYTTTTTVVGYSVGLDSNQVIYEIPTDEFSQGTFQIRSADTNSANSQDITLTAQLTTSGSVVKFTGYGTTFAGSYLTRYDMDVSGGNVRILVNPILDVTIQHFISVQVTYLGTPPVGIDLGLDGYPAGSVLLTEAGLDLTTEGI